MLNNILCLISDGSSHRCGTWQDFFSYASVLSADYFPEDLSIYNHSQ